MDRGLQKQAILNTVNAAWAFIDCRILRSKMLIQAVIGPLEIVRNRFQRSDMFEMTARNYMGSLQTKESEERGIILRNDTSCISKTYLFTKRRCLNEISGPDNGGRMTRYRRGCGAPTRYGPHTGNFGRQGNRDVMPGVICSSYKRTG